MNTVVPTLPARNTCRTGRARVGGLVAAIGLACVFAAVIAIAMRNRSTGSDAAMRESDAPPMDIKSLPIPSGAAGAGLGKATSLAIDIADRRDPSRRAQLITAESTEQLENRNYRMARPVAWAFGRNGRISRITADSGDAYIPSDDKGARPESATLKGHVTMSIFDAIDERAGTSGTPDAIQGLVPSLTVKTPSLRYEGTPGKISTRDRFEVGTDQLTFVGRGLTLLLNEVDQRIEYLKIDKAEPGFTYHIGHPKNEKAKGGARRSGQRAGVNPATETAATVAGIPAAASNTSNASTAPSKPAVPAAPTYYHVTAKDSVVVTFGERTIESDGLELWLRLIGNSLPPGAIAAMAPPDKAAKPPAADGSNHPGAASTAADPTTRPSHTPESSPNSTPDAASRPDHVVALTTPTGEVITVVWRGVLEVRPLADTPEELTRDDVAVRFTADPGAGGRVVNMRDRASGATATGTTLDYAATTRRIALVGDEAHPARLMMPDTGHATATRFAIDLGSGAVLAQGAGELRASEKQGESARSVGWTHEAAFTFAMRDGQMTSQLVEARPVGDVVATDSNGSLRGGRMIARFMHADQKPGESTQTQTAISVLEVDDEVSADDGSDGLLECSHLLAEFSPSLNAKGSHLSKITAFGEVLGTKAGDVLRTDMLVVDLTPGKPRESGSNDRTPFSTGAAISTMDATGSVIFQGRDGTNATGDVMHADTARQQVFFLSDSQSTWASVGQNQTFARGHAIELTGGDSGGVTIRGPGSFDHTNPANGNQPAAHAEAVWTRGMSFDNATSELICEGAVHGTWKPDPLRTDALHGDRLVVRLTRGTTRGVTGNTDTRELSAGGRTLLSARVLGNPEARASIESRTVASSRVGDDSAPAASSVLYIEGREIVTDNEAGTLSVPGDGVLYTLDQKEAHPGAAPSAPALLTDPSRGGPAEARIAWSHSMSAKRKEGTIDFMGGVKLRHRSIETGAIVDLECESLLARLRESNVGASTGASGAGQLQSASAHGSVWLKSGTREMTAETAVYDALASEVDATAGETDMVTLVDSTQAAPITGRSLLWNIKTGRVELRAPGTVLAPK